MKKENNNKLTVDEDINFKFTFFFELLKVKKEQAK